MCTPMVVDANCIVEYQKERIQSCKGPAHVALDHIFDNGWIVVCEKCLNKWLSSASGSGHLALSDWLNNRLVDRTIRLIPQVTNGDLATSLRKLGLPKEDAKWFQVAENQKAYGIVSEDIDLFEPAAKKRKDAQKKREERRGAVADFARKNLGIQVMTLGHVPQLVPRCQG